MITSKNWQSRMSEDMRLRDYRPKTQQAYELAVRQFLRWVEREPETLTEEHVRAYVLHLREEKQQAPSSINIAVCGLRFFFSHTLRRDWPVFELMRVKQPQKLPVVLSTGEVRSVLGAVRQPVRRMAFRTIYSLGLRIGECLRLEAGDIDSERSLVWVRNGKGAKDRGVPLPRPTLHRLRQYWAHERPASPTRRLFVASNSKSALHETTLQKTFTAAQKEVGLRKPAVVHTLRHSYASHLLENGISLRTIQALLGHKSLRSTEVYLHVTQTGTERLQEVLDRLMADL